MALQLFRNPPVTLGFIAFACAFSSFLCFGFLYVSMYVRNLFTSTITATPPSTQSMVAITENIIDGSDFEVDSLSGFSDISNPTLKSVAKILRWEKWRKFTCKGLSSKGLRKLFMSHKRKRNLKPSHVNCWTDSQMILSELPEGSRLKCKVVQSLNKETNSGEQAVLTELALSSKLTH